MNQWMTGDISHALDCCCTGCQARLDAALRLEKALFMRSVALQRGNAPKLPAGRQTQENHHPL